MNDIVLKLTPQCSEFTSVLHKKNVKKLVGYKWVNQSWVNMYNI